MPWSISLCRFLHKPSNLNDLRHVARNVIFPTIVAGPDVSHARTGERLLDPGQLLVLSACPVSHDSVQWLTATTDFAVRYFPAFVVLTRGLFLVGAECVSVRR